MKASTDVMSQVEICDSISNEIKKLQMVYTFLSQISDVCHEEKIQFIGRWNIDWHIGCEVKYVAVLVGHYFNSYLKVKKS